MLSLIFPICNRTDLFKVTLETIARQTMPLDEFEIVVVDDGGTCERLVPLLATMRVHGLNIRYYKINIDGLPFPIFRHGLFNNPAPALNIGIRNARNPRIVLSSPEIAHELITNLDRLDTWPLEEHQALIADVFDLALQHHSGLCGMIGGGPGKRPLHFLGAYSRDRLMEMGGFEEQFVEGWGFDDTEFVHRWQVKWGGEFLFTGPAVRALHQPHPRVEEVNRSGVKRGEEIQDAIFADPNYRVANPGRLMGDPAMIVEDKWNE